MKERFQPCVAAIVGVLLLGGAAIMGACNGTTTLAPPDGTACTKGSIAPGDSIAAMVTSASCSAYSTLNYQQTYRDSWTLAMHKNTGYVIRLRHVADSAAVDHWRGDLLAFTRNSAGDPVFATGWRNMFGPANPNGGHNEEMYLATTRDQTLSIRVESAGVYDTGAYTLSVESCPLFPMAVGGGISGLDVASGCTGLALGPATPQHVVFATFPGDTGLTYHATVDRTAGTGGLRATLSGPDLDVNCWTDACNWSLIGPGSAIALDATPAVAGLQSLMIYTDADSAATVTVGNTSAPAPVARPSTSRPAHPALRGTP